MDNPRFSIEVLAAGLTVHIFQKQVKRLYALNQTTFNLFPVRCGHNSWRAVNGNNSFLGLLIPINGKSYALVGK